MAVDPYLSELFRIVEGALRLDGEKVRNYVDLLAEKLQKAGDTASSQRLRRLLREPGIQLRPSKITQEAPPPVDGESRFPLVQRIPVRPDAEEYLFTNGQKDFIEDYLQVVQARGILESKGIVAGTNLLLYGPPGCGKTRLAVYVAHRLSLPLFAARLDGLISSFLGSTAKNIRSVFEFATKTPCVLLLDEFDAIAKLRDDQQELGELKRVVNSFIQNLDALGHDLILIAATNHEQLLDPAVWRRFQYLLRIDLPNHDQRERLWKTFSCECEWSPKELWALADLSAGFSCAAIETASIRLRQSVVTKGSQPRLREAISHLLSAARPEANSLPIINRAILDDPGKLQKLLSQRNSRRYSLTIIGEIAGLSKATMSRRTKSKAKIRRKRLTESQHERRTPLH